MKRSKNIKRKAAVMLPPVLLLIITFCIYMPSSLFLGNIDEFALDYVQIVPLIFFVSAIVFAAVYLLGLICVHERVFKSYVLIIFSIAVGFYLQGNFLNPAFDNLNGRQIDWSQYKIQGIISVIIWLACIVIPQVMLVVKEKYIASIVKWGSYILCAMQTVSLIVMIMSTTRSVDSGFAITKKDEFQMSSKDNVVMFVVDTLDAQWFEEYVLDDSLYSDYFNDFTYYENAVAGGAPTQLGIPTLLTGKSYSDVTTSVDQYYSDAYGNSTLFKDMTNNNYKVKLYTEYNLLNKSDVSQIDNAVTGQKYVISWKSAFIKYLYKFTSFYAMPQFLKQNFWFYSNDLSDLVTIDNKEADIYKFDDPQFYEDYRNAGGISLQSDSNAFIMYHLTGAHGPYTMNENAKRISETTIDQQISGSFKIITEIIDDMKSKGIYENATIIITADHGGLGLYQNPTILLKQKNESKEFSVSDAPVMFKNVNATIASCTVKNSQSYGKTLTEVREDENSVRYHTAPKDIGKQSFPDVDFVNSQEWTVYRISGNARDVKNCEPLPAGQEYNTGN